MAHYIVLDQDGNLIYRIVGGHLYVPEFQELLAKALDPKTHTARGNEPAL